jgi:ParB/RepB/Spo0J family partition protein
MKLPISSIAIINRQRREIDQKKLLELAESIKTHGLLHPIVVREPFASELDSVGTARYVLCVGGRRLAAHLLLGQTEIESNLKTDLDALSAKIVELEENIARANITWQEEVDARAQIHEIRVKQNPLQTFEDTAKETGTSKPQIWKDVQLKKAIEADPTLRNAPTKASAIRAAKHRQHVARRLETVLKAKDSDIDKKLITADARVFLKDIPTRSVDLVFTDLPYGIDYFKTGGKHDQQKGHYDDSTEVAKSLILDILPDIGRIVKPEGWIALFMCYEWHGWLMTHLANICTTHHETREHKVAQFCSAGDASSPCTFLRPELKPWIWTRKGKGNFGHYPELHAASRYEMLVICNGGEARLVKKPVEDVLDFPALSEERFHAMQKPHDLCLEVIDRLTVPGELVVDCCMGSGALLAAAAAKGRDFAGCDINPENLKSAIVLVSQHYHRAAPASAPLALLP